MQGKPSPHCIVKLWVDEEIAAKVKVSQQKDDLTSQATRNIQDEAFSTHEIIALVSESMLVIKAGDKLCQKKALPFSLETKDALIEFIDKAFHAIYVQDGA